MKKLFKRCWLCARFMALVAVFFAPLARGDPSNPYLANAVPVQASPTIFSGFNFGKVVQFFGGKEYDPPQVMRTTYVIPAGCPPEKALQMLHVHIKLPSGDIARALLGLFADGVSAVTDVNLEFSCFGEAQPT